VIDIAGTNGLFSVLRYCIVVLCYIQEREQQLHEAKERARAKARAKAQARKQVRTSMCVRVCVRALQTYQYLLV
jgi:hypothetical protein